MQAVGESKLDGRRREAPSLLRALFLAVILLGLRIPLLDHPRPYHPDESESVAAIGFPRDYPVHQPGYPLWVALGTALTALGVESYRAYQLWSVAASIAGPLLLYHGLSFLRNERLAWWTAAAFGVCPLVWFTAATALNYSLACAAALWVVGLSVRSLDTRHARSALAAAAALALALFLRPDLLLWLGPLTGYALWRAGRRPILRGTLLLGAAVAACLALNLWLYRRDGSPVAGASIAHTAQVVFATSVFHLGVYDGLFRSVVKLLMNLGWHLGPAVLLLGSAIARCRRLRAAMPMQTAALLVWVLPMTAFLLLVHVTEPAHLLVLLPAFYALIAMHLSIALPARAAARLMTVAAIASTLQFSLYPWSAESTGPKGLIDRKIGYISAAGLRQIDRWREVNQPGDFWPTDAHRPPPPRSDTSAPP